MNTTDSIDSITVEQGSANPYADLGYPDADEMLVKAELAREVAQINDGPFTRDFPCRHVLSQRPRAS